MSSVVTHLTDEKIYFICGSSSVYVPSLNRKYLNSNTAKRWPNIEGELEYMTPGEAARVELEREFDLITKVGWPKGLVTLFDHRSPIHYGGQAWGGMTYVDLKGAYVQIYSRLHLDQAWPRSMGGRYPLRGVAKRLEIWKGARNALMGVIRSREATAVKDGRRITISTQNRWLSPGLWATVQDVLHMVADMALLHGAIYINVDGYIFPYVLGKEVDDFLYWLTSMGLIGEIRATGEGEISSWNSYRVGKYQTKPYSLGLDTINKEFSNVYRNEREKWVKWWRRIGRVV